VLSHLLKVLQLPVYEFPCFLIKTTREKNDPTVCQVATAASIFMSLESVIKLVHSLAGISKVCFLRRTAVFVLQRCAELYTPLPQSQGVNLFFV
jgi:hypothetical protein